MSTKIYADVIISGIPAIVGHLFESGMVDPSVPVIHGRARKPHVVGKHVVGTLAMHLTVQSRSVWELPLDRRALRNGTITKAQIAKFAGDLVQYQVTRGYKPAVVAFAHAIEQVQHDRQVYARFEPNDRVLCRRRVEPDAVGFKNSSNFAGEADLHAGYYRTYASGWSPWIKVEPWAPDVIVTVHPALAQHLVESGTAPPGTPVVAHATTDSVRGRHVLGGVSHHFASLAKSVTACGMRLEAQDHAALGRGEALSIERVRQVAMPLQTYMVRKGYWPAVSAFAKAVDHAGDLDFNWCNGIIEVGRGDLRALVDPTYGAVRLRGRVRGSKRSDKATWGPWLDPDTGDVFRLCTITRDHDGRPQHEMKVSYPASDERIAHLLED